MRRDGLAAAICVEVVPLIVVTVITGPVAVDCAVAVKMPHPIAAASAAPEIAPIANLEFLIGQPFR